MGRDKATLAVDGQPLALRVAAALTAAAVEPVVAVGGRTAALQELGFDTVADLWPGEGPLGGIITALEAASSPWVLVVSCDLADLDGTAVQALLAARDGTAADVLFASGGRVSYTCGLWRRTASTVLRTRFDSGERAIHRALDNLNVVVVDVSPTALVNLNSPDDLRDRRRPE